MISLPIALMDVPVGVLEFLSQRFPALQDTAEFGKIGRYYAAESMLVWDEQRQQYDSAATPSMGQTPWSSSSSGLCAMAWKARISVMRHCSDDASSWG